MTNNRYASQNRFHAPLSEKMDDELILAIRKGQTDADACRAQLVENGWTAERIDAAVHDDRVAVEITGSGTTRCDECNGRLDYSWAVKFSDGSHGSFCSLHTPAIFR